MAHYLPPAIMAFFQPRAPLEYKEPIEKKRMPSYSGVANFVHRFKDIVKEPVIEQTTTQKKEKRKLNKLSKINDKLKRQLAKWDPKSLDKLQNGTKDAYKTLFVARLAYDVTEDD